MRLVIFFPFGTGTRKMRGSEADQGSQIVHTISDHCPHWRFCLHKDIHKQNIKYLESIYRCT